MTWNKIQRTVTAFVLGLVIPELGNGASSSPASIQLKDPIVLSLEECIQRALSNAPGLEAAEFDRMVVEKKLSEAASAYILPELKLRAFGGPVPDVPDGSGPPNFPSVDTGISDLGLFFRARVEAIQPIYTFGKLSGLKEAAKRGVHAKKAQEAVAKNELIYRVKKAYFGLAYLYSLHDFIKELQDRSAKARKRVEEQLQKHSPDVTDIDRMRLDVFSAETNRRLVELENGIVFALSAIKILTGISSSTPIGIKDKKIKVRKINIKPVKYYLNRARVARPEVQQLEDNVRIRRALLKSTRADFFPSFFIGGFYQYSIAPDRQDVDNPFLVDDFNVNSGGAALGLEQSLSFHLTSARYGQALAEYHKALAQQRQAMQGIEIEIRKRHSNAVSKRDAMKSSRAAFKAGRSWVLATTLNFGVGLVPVKDLLESFVAYSKVKVSFFDILHDFEKSLAELAKAVGEEVSGLKY